MAGFGGLSFYAHTALFSDTSNHFKQKSFRRFCAAVHVKAFHRPLTHRGNPPPKPVCLLLSTNLTVPLPVPTPTPPPAELVVLPIHDPVVVEPLPVLGPPLAAAPAPLTAAPFTPPLLASCFSPRSRHSVSLFRWVACCMPNAAC
jgi:hypothetical protein